MSDYVVTLSKNVNFGLLNEQVKALTLPEHGISMASLNDGSKVVTVHFEVEPSNAEKAAIDAVLAAHDGAQLTAIEQARAVAKAEVVALAILDKDPEQLILWLQNQIDAWATLADAKLTLRKALPVMLAILLDPSVLED